MFVYLDEDGTGTLDVMVWRTGGQGTSRILLVHWQNRFDYDTLVFVAIETK